ncbi:PAAR domain-containing protein [Ralstonia sp. R-29]|uniref:PAAR domain-containing protein n=1 Tax=Ralstonia sp. R-29 TaxID=3404059 RepID=UPI003CEFC117
MSAGQPFIVVGDKTSHGGIVITGDGTSSMYGKPMARSGDMTVCPKCKGTFPILKSSSIVVDGVGNTYARHMDKTSCEANLLAGAGDQAGQPRRTRDRCRKVNAWLSSLAPRSRAANAQNQN